MQVLKPYVNASWMQAQVMQVTTQGVTVTYGGSTMDLLTHATPNCVVRML